MVEFQITALVCTSIELIGTLNMYKYQIIHLLAGVIEVESCEIVIHIPPRYIPHNRTTTKIINVRCTRANSTNIH